MSYTIHEEKIYPHTKEDLTKAILGAIEGLEGKVVKHQAELGLISATFSKTILGNFLGDRTQLDIELTGAGPEEVKCSLTIFPINPVGQKLEFGARKGVSRKVLTWFIAHVDHRLK